MEAVDVFCGTSKKEIFLIKELIYLESRFGKNNAAYVILEASMMKTKAGHTKKTAGFGGLQLGFIKYFFWLL